MNDFILLTEAQTSHRLGVTTKALQAWRCRGGGPTYIRVGRLIRYSLLTSGSRYSTFRAEQGGVKRMLGESSANRDDT